MLRAYKYRLYPTQEQAEFFSKSFGCCRVAYNRTLDYMSMMWCGAGVGVSYYSAKAQLVALKEFYPWFGEVNSQSLQYAVKQVADAFKNWWEHRANHPIPKCKKNRQAFHNPQSCSVDWKHKTLSIPKCKNIPIVLNRSFYGKIKDVTISMNPDGKYYASILVDTAISEKPCCKVEASTTIGIDTGVKTFAVCSDGRKFETPHFAKAAEKRLKHYQRELRHKTKGSANWKKVQHHIACIHAKVANQRLDYIHKVTHQLTHDSQVRTICIEDLNIEGMKRLWGRKVSDLAFSAFVSKLEQVASKYGCEIRKVDRYFASSKTCEHCGYVNKELKLSDRLWICPDCGSVLDRDLNAAKNILRQGIASSGSPRKTKVILRKGR